MSKNEYGLDCDYFKKNLKIIIRDIDRYTPSEMFRTLSNLMMTSADQAGYKVELKTKFRK